MKIHGHTVTKAQGDVYHVLNAFGKSRGIPDHALVPLAQHALDVHQSSSGIRTRRKELFDLGLVEFNGFTTTGAGRRAAVYRVKR